MARRINKQFVIPAVIVAVVGIVGLGLAAKWKLDWSKNPTPHVQAGDEAMKQGRYDEAIEAYAKAIRLKDNDPTVWVRLGDAHNMLAADDINNLYKARQVWESAVTQDPRLMDAHRRLLSFWTDWADAMSGAGRASYLERAADAARGILRVAPDDKRAKYIIQEAVIEAWLSGAATDPQKVDDAMEALRQLATESPNDHEIPYTLARATAQKGFEAIRRGDKPEATRLLDEAVKIIDDALAANPESGPLTLRKAQLLVGIGPRIEQDRDDSQMRAKTAKLNEEVAVLAERARTLMKPEDKEYVQAWVFAAVMAQRIGKADEAEKILRQLVAERPEEIVPKIQLAEQMRTSPERWEEALALVTTPLPAGTLKPGVAGQIQRDAERRALILATDIRLDLFAAAREKNDSATADALMKQVESDLALIAAKEPDSGRTLRLRGKMELFKRDMVASVQTLNRALTIATDPSDRTRYEIMYLLARAYQATQQTGEAEKLFRDMVERVDYPPARIELARLLLAKRAIEEARGHIAQLKQQQPQNPEVVRLELAMADLEGKKNTEASLERLAELPENTDKERLDKARLALMLNRPDDTIRLMEPVYEKNRDNVSFLLPIAGAYEQKKQVDRTTALLQEYQSRHPDNALVRDYLERLRGATNVERAEIVVDAIRKQRTDPVDRAVEVFDVYRRLGQWDKAEQELATVPADRVNEPKMLDARYQLAFYKGDFDAAESYIETLAKANQDNANGLIYRARLLMGRATAETDPARKKAFWDRATETGVRLAQERGEFSSAWLLLAQIYHAQRRYEEAINAYTQAKDRQAQNIDAYEGLIRCYYGLGRNADAKRVIDDARKLFPQNPVFEEMELTWEAQFGDPAKIIPSREAQLKANPDSPLAYGNLGAAYAAAGQSKSGAEQTQLLEKSRETFAKGIAKFPTDPSLISAHGDVCLLLNRFDDGLKAWAALQANEPYKSSPQIAARVADYYRRGGRLADGRQHLQDFLARVDDPLIRITLADYLNAEGNVDAALAELAKVPDDPRSLRRRTEILINNQRLSEAEGLINAALQRQPDSLDLQNRLAFVYLMSDREPQAKETLTKVIAARPRDPEALFYLALVEVKTRGDGERAIAYLQQVRDLVPSDVDARKLLVDLYLQRNRLPAAIEEMENILRLQNDDKTTRIKLIETFLATQPPRVVDAERLCREAQSIPSLAKDADMMHAYARTLLIKGDIQGSVSYINEARKLDPNNLPLMDTFFRIMMGAKQYQGVVTEATKLLEKNGTLPWLWSTRASAYARLKQPDKALADFEQGYNLAQEKGDDFGASNIIRAMMLEVGVEQAQKFLEPRVGDNPAKKFLLSQVFMNAGKTTDAIRVAEDIAKDMASLRPSMQVQVLNFLGTVYLSQSPPDVAKASVYFDQVLKLTPNDYRTLNNMAYLKLLPQSGATPQEALQYSQRAYDTMVANNTLEPEIMDTHGAALIEVGRLAEAVNVLTDAVNRKPTLGEGWYHLGLAQFKQGNLKEADDALRRAEQLIDEQRKSGQPVDPVVEGKIQQLRIDLPRAGE